MPLSFYNSLTRQKEVFIAINQDKVGVYNCGPTVYNTVSIGNWRTYVLGDIVLRTLKYFGYRVDYVMNITDVGHLTGDNLGDSSAGEDRQEKAARREGQSAWEVARKYTDNFLHGYRMLNLTQPKIFCKATDHIPEQIRLIRQISQKGFTYKTPDGIYFSVQAYEKAGNIYPPLSTLDRIKEGARVKKNPYKKDPRDFALWKFSYPDGRSFKSAQDDTASRRQMEWDSPWGVGFPGWHIECSAMSMKYLGEKFDIHLGGEDLRSTHHPNEILQSESATGQKPFVRYWLHGAFLTVDGGRMGKSLGNAYTLDDLAGKGFGPLDLRYFYLTGHYRKQLNFTWEALAGARRALANLRERVGKLLSASPNKTNLPHSANSSASSYNRRFRQYLGDDLDLPMVLALAWEMLKDKKLPDRSKRQLILEWDQVLGLDLEKVGKVGKVDKSTQILAEKREALRKEQKFTEADKIRQEIERQGYLIEDSAHGTRVKPKS